MEQPICVLLIEDDVKDCNEIQTYAESLDDIDIAGVTGNATEALDLAKALLPDVVILDLELHQGGGNGLFFLLGLNQLNLPVRPYILITTNNMSNMTFETARQLGADFILAKYEQNYCAQYVLEFVRMLKGTLAKRDSVKDEDAEQTPAERERRCMHRIQRELDLIGISPKALGMQYLADAILMTIRNPEPNISHVLAQKYKKSDASVERAMQNAINQAWRNSDPDDLINHYTAKIRSDRGVPTLMEFISHYAAKIKMDMEKK